MPNSATGFMNHCDMITYLFLCCRDDRLRSLRVKMNFHLLACTIIRINKTKLHRKEK